MSLLRLQAELHRAKHLDWWDFVDDAEAPATTDPGTSLLSLPTELYFAISKYLHWWDIYSLRLTCRLMNYVLPPLKDHGNLPSLELSIEMYKPYHGYCFPIPVAWDFPVIGSCWVYTRRYHFTSISDRAAPLMDSFYMTNRGYYICFGCKSIKDNKEWYEWRDNRLGCGEYRKQGVPWKAWQRCGDCDKVLQELVPQRCPEHGKGRRRTNCQRCHWRPQMLRIGVSKGPKKKQVRKRPLLWW